MERGGQPIVLMLDVGFQGMSWGQTMARGRGGYVWRRRVKRAILAALALATGFFALFGGQAVFAEWWVARRPDFQTPNAATPEELAFLRRWRPGQADEQPPLQATALPPKASTVGAGALRFHNASDRTIRNIWIHRRGEPNFHSIATLAASATAGAGTETDKAVALWRLFERYYVHRYPPALSGAINHPLILLTSFGAAQCDNATFALRTLCHECGLRTRDVGVDWTDGTDRIAHHMLEAYADGRWILMDPDGRAMYRASSRHWASAADLRSHPEVVAESAHGYYAPAHFAQAFAWGDLQRYPPSGPAAPATGRPPLACFRHAMQFTLLPGESVAFPPGPPEKIYRGSDGRDRYRLANGVMTWRLRAATLDGLYLRNLGLRAEGGNLLVQPALWRTGTLIVPQASPYVIVRGELRGRIAKGGPARVAILAFQHGAAAPRPEWQPVGDAAGDFTLRMDAPFDGAPVFAFALRIEFARHTVVEALRLRTLIQCNRDTLPTATPGAGELVLLSEPGTNAPGRIVIGPWNRRPGDTATQATMAAR